MLIKTHIRWTHFPARLLFGAVFVSLTLILYSRRSLLSHFRIKLPSTRLGLGRLNRVSVHQSQSNLESHSAIQNISRPKVPQDDPPTHYQSAQNLWARLQPLLDGHDPGVPAVKAVEPIDFATYDPDDTDWTKDLLKLKTEDIVKMRDSHQRYLEKIKQEFGVFKPSANVARRGIVVTASKDYLPVLMVTLRMLMRTKTTLPVEVWIHKWDEYEEKFCEDALPGMNAKCHVMEEVLMHEGGNHKPSKTFLKFEYKIFAILFSSFQEVLYLDADAFPLHPPEELFDNDPYRRTGMVLWPDIWRESISPSYYLVNNLKPHHRGKRAATESGQMMFNKETHIQTLLLAAYYNYYGESHYYSLLSQNGPGRGDKDTFAPAADTLRAPYWQVHEPVATLGHDFGQFGYWVLAMIQWDPAQDFHRYRDLEPNSSFNSMLQEDLVEIDSFDDDEPPRTFFMHCNSRKWNPKDVLEYLGGYDLAWDLEGNPMKAYTDPPELVRRLGSIERIIWEEVKWVACETSLDFRSWEGKKADICNGIGRYYFTVVNPKDEVEPFIPALNEEFIEWLQNEREKMEKEQSAD